MDDALTACEKLPVLAGPLLRVLHLAGRDEATVGELVEAIEAEASLASNVLRFANSGAHMRLHRMKTVRQAVTMVGRRRVRRLALDSVAYGFFERAPGNGGVSRGQLHLHAVHVAHLAARCAELAAVSDDAAHLAGLLHDCGKLVLPVAFGEEQVDAIALAHPAGHDRALAERRDLGIDHARAGALLASASGVDDEVVRAIAWHHGAPDGRLCPDRITACVQLADAVVNAGAGLPLDHAVCEAALSMLGLPDGVVEDLAASMSPVRRAAPESLSSRVAELEKVALVDGLTGLASRRAWLEQVGALLARGQQGSLLVCDVDRLDAVNDEHGRHNGDLLLCEVARLARRYGLAGRLAGDEFGVWVAGEPSAGPVAANALVQDVRAACNEQPGAARAITVSVGVASAGAGGHVHLPGLLGAAHRALHEAKRLGRDRVADDLAA